jgi:hypothetical protein
MSFAVAGGLDRRDRRMLYVFLALVFVLIVILAVVSPNKDDDPLPGSNLSGRFGAKAAFTLLQQSGYVVERWEDPLTNLAEHADESTVVILAQPYSQEWEDQRAVREILTKGGRVLATGLSGGMLLPGNGVHLKLIKTGICKAKPEGIEPLATPGLVWMLPQGGWRSPGPQYRTAYSCEGSPVVVEYPYGKGHAVWWANSTPLENARIGMDQDLELLLNSVGPTQVGGKARHIYWDESLHGIEHTRWDYTSGPIWPLLQIGFFGLVLLVVLSYSRRSGPIRPLPEEPRTTPIEFLEALGALYRSAGANTTAIQVAWDRFRAVSSKLCGLRSGQLDARQLAAAIERRFGPAAKGMEADLIEAEEACWDEALKPKRALLLVQGLHRHEETLRLASLARTSVQKKAS